jgi:hypothetical protein
MAEIVVYVISFVFVIINNSSLSSSYYSVSLFHCSLYKNPWYFPMTFGLWIAPPGVVVMLMVVTLTMMILKQRRQIYDQQLVVKRAVGEVTSRRQTSGVPGDKSEHQPSTTIGSRDNVTDVNTQKVICRMNYVTVSVSMNRNTVETRLMSLQA